VEVVVIPTRENLDHHVLLQRMVEEVVVAVMAAVMVATIAMVFPPINLRTEVLPKAVLVLVTPLA
jgi:hypothetical protein